ncbi:glucuronate isomerase, partial [Pantoea sp. SIMBA_133]
MNSDNVEFIGTTDDPTDSLSYHTKIQKENYCYNVVPSFRPDKGLQINANGFVEWVSNLEKRTKSPIQNYTDFLEALYSRIDYFE